MNRLIIIFLLLGDLYAQKLPSYSWGWYASKQEPKGILKVLYAPDEGISLSLQNAHTSGIISTTASEKGKYVVTTSHDYTNKLWETGFKKILQTFNSGSSAMTKVFFMDHDSVIFMGGNFTYLYCYKLYSKQLEEIPFRLYGKLVSVVRKNKNSWWVLTSEKLLELVISGNNYEYKSLHYEAPVKNPFTGAFKIVELIELRQALAGNIIIHKSDGSSFQVSGDGTIGPLNITKKPLTLPAKAEFVINRWQDFTVIGERAVVYVYMDNKRHDKIYCNKIEHQVTGIVSLGNAKFAWVNNGGEITCYDAKEKKVYFRNVFKNYSFTSIGLDSIHRKLYLGDARGELSTFDLRTFLFSPIKLAYTGVEDVDYDYKGSHLLWSDNLGFLNSMEFESGRFKTSRLKLDNYEITAIKYSPLRNTILAAGFENRLYEISSGDSLSILRKKMIKKRPAKRNISYLLSKAVNRPIRHRLQALEINLYKNDSIIACDMINNKPFLLFRAHGVQTSASKSRHFNSLTIRKTKKPVVNISGSFKTPSTGYTINQNIKNESRFITTEGAIAVETNKSHNGLLSGTTLCENAGLQASSGRDGSIQLWKVSDTNQIKKVCTIYPNSKNERLMVNPENFYWGSWEILTRVGFNFKGRYFFPDQFDFIYNRPDLVLKSIDSLKYAELISTFYRAYQKRLKKAGLTEKNIALNIDSLPVMEVRQLGVTDEKAMFKISMAANGKNVKRINVWNNGVPVFGENGLPALKAGETRSVIISLASGNNKLQFSALDQSGSEGFRSTFVISATDDTQKSDLYFVGLGCSKYSQQQYNLTYAAKDVSDLNEVVKTAGKYKNVHSLLLVNNDFTFENIKKIRQFLLQSGPNDQVILFYAGHGVLDKNYNYYLTPANTDFSSPETTAIPYEWIEAQMDSIPAYRKILLIDACHSGDIDKEDLVTMASVKTTGSKDIKFRKVGSAQYAYSSNNAFEVSKELFTDLRRGTGTTVISSSGGLEFAMEGKKWSNGLFTYCLLNGIKTKKADYNGDKSISVSEIKKYVQEQVRLMSNGLQTPVTRNDNIESDYLLW